MPSRPRELLRQTWLAARMTDERYGKCSSERSSSMVLEELAVYQSVPRPPKIAKIEPPKRT